MNRKYISYFISAIILAGAFFPLKINYEWIGLLMLFIAIILLFEVVEESRPKRIKRWSANPKGKFSHMMKFSLFLGLPISIIIMYLIRGKAQLFFSALFILLPVVLIFAWIGFLDWQACIKLSLQEKYKVDFK